MFDFRLEKVKNNDISNKGRFRKMISDRLGEGRGSFLSIGDIEGVPLLQILLPVNFEKWNGEEPILVAYTPLTIDDTEWEEISAYDSEGNEYVLDAKTPPDFPVMVVGINERVDPVTKKVRFGANESFLGKAALTTGVCSYYDVININIINVFDDKEPWSKGAAEIFTKVTYGSDSKRTNFTDLDYEGSYHYTNTSWLPKEVYRRSQIINVWKIKVMEDDWPHWLDKDDLLDKEWHISEDLTDTASELIVPIPMLENRWLYGKNRNVDFRFIIERD